jgi:hypothetical protein
MAALLVVKMAVSLVGRRVVVKVAATVLWLVVPKAAMSVASRVVKLVVMWVE